MDKIQTGTGNETTEVVKPNHTLSAFAFEVKSISVHYSLKLIQEEASIVVIHKNQALNKSKAAVHQKLFNYLTFFNASYNLVDRRGNKLTLLGV